MREFRRHSRDPPSPLLLYCEIGLYQQTRHLGKKGIMTKRDKIQASLDDKK